MTSSIYPDDVIKRVKIFSPSNRNKKPEEKSERIITFEKYLFRQNPITSCKK